MKKKVVFGSGKVSRILARLQSKTPKEKCKIIGRELLSEMELKQIEISFPNAIERNKLFQTTRSFGDLLRDKTLELIIVIEETCSVDVETKRPDYLEMYKHESKNIHGLYCDTLTFKVSSDIPESDEFTKDLFYILGSDEDINLLNDLIVNETSLIMEGVDDRKFIQAMNDKLLDLLSIKAEGFTAVDRNQYTRFAMEEKYNIESVQIYSDKPEQLEAGIRSVIKVSENIIPESDFADITQKQNEITKKSRNWFQRNLLD